MKTLGAFTVVRNSDKHILLVKRRDFPLWDLPGGRVEKGENTEQAAVRETFEETGFVISLEQLTGIYDNIERADRQYIFTGKIISGTAIKSGPETAKLQFFSIHHLPFLMVPHRKMQIKKSCQHTDSPIFQEIRDNWLIKYIKNH
ncbi:NUDIX hydrolase [Lactococcus allomyrinae]|uniref:NUDIX hydrolase n=1 Tax=Lactococcus allomyrinae TaxID=2419773 RepID=A0A387BFG8_9LACT|nr:NUDIX hydrolase [Lactococcus allomyrinae]AYF99659.1 NUDIX hydrolase [Lactococcus allomyrinae]